MINKSKKFTLIMLDEYCQFLLRNIPVSKKLFSLDDTKLNLGENLECDNNVNDLALHYIFIK